MKENLLDIGLEDPHDAATWESCAITARLATTARLAIAVLLPTTAGMALCLDFPGYGIALQLEHCMRSWLQL